MNFEILRYYLTKYKIPDFLNDYKSYLFSGIDIPNLESENHRYFLKVWPKLAEENIKFMKDFEAKYPNAIQNPSQEELNSIFEDFKKTYFIPFLKETYAYNFLTKQEADDKLSKEIRKFFEERLSCKQECLKTNIREIDKLLEYCARSRKGLDFPFKEILDKIPSGTLSIFCAPSGTGKSMFLIHLMAHNIKEKCLYITLEMSHFEIQKRILANILDTPLNYFSLNVGSLEFREKIQKKISKISEFQLSDIIYQEPNVFSPKDLESILENQDLSETSKYKYIFIDYISLMNENNPNENNSTYIKLKRISEELRGIALKYGVAIVTAAQVNRSGYQIGKSDLSSMSESMGIVHTADFIAILKKVQALEEKFQYQFRFDVEKNRIDGKQNSYELLGDTSIQKFEYKGEFQDLKEVQKSF